MWIPLAALSVVFLAIELPLMTRRRSGTTARDAGSFWVTQVVGLAILGAVVGITVDARFAFARAGLWTLAVALPMFGVGAVVRVLAVRALGQYFTVVVQTSPDQKVIDFGPYRYIRHPSYTGLILEALALGFATGNLLALAVVAAASLIPLGYRIRVEEAALLAGLGEPYRAYMARTRRLIPFLF